MTQKTANLRIRVEPELHEQFLATCKRLDVHASQILRQCMRSFIEQHQNTTQVDLFKKEND